MNIGDFLKNLLKLASAQEPQAWLFDSTTYCRMYGLAPEKIVQHNFAGMLIQSGRGMWISDTLQDQIDVAEETGLNYAIWHIGDPREGTPAQHAKLIAAQPRVAGHILIGDLERKETGVPASMWLPAQCPDFLKALADESGRASMGYGNPDVLINYLGMPAWIYDYDWWVAQYPNSSWRRFEDFLNNYGAWRYPSYFSDNPEFCKRIKFMQWTRWGDAQFYYAATKLPDGGSGIRGGDLDIAYMTHAETVAYLATKSDPVPPPPNTDLEKQVANLEIRVSQNELDIVYLTDEIAKINDKLEGTPDPVDPEPEPSSTIRVRPLVDGKAVVFKTVGYDKSCPGENPPGKPIAEPPATGRVVYKYPAIFEIVAKFAISCKDDPDDYIVHGAGYDFGVVAPGYAGSGNFVRLDKIELLE